MTLPAVVSGFISGAGASRRLLATLVSRPPGGLARWERTNYAGRTVTLLGGPAYVGAATVTCLTARAPWRMRLAIATGVLGAGAVGVYDDIVGGPHARGLRGHLRALVHGEVTTGAVKIAGLGVVGLVAARCAGLRGVDSVVTGAAVAGSANVANLLDLRPGRVVKASLVVGAPALAGPAAGPAAAALGAAVALLPDDLGERTMLGDGGAAALGSAVGLGLALRTDRRGRRRMLGAVSALTLASEFVSFTKVIAAVPPLRALDELGRFPALAT